MLNTADIKQTIVFNKNLVTDQNFSGLNVLLNTSDTAFSGSHGLGANTGNSFVVGINVGGFEDQKITAVMKYVTPTTAGTEDFGLLIRFKSFKEAAAQHYYYIRCDAGDCKITRVVSGSFTTLTQTPFVLTQNEDVTITCEMVGEQITATFSASSVGSKTLTATDSQINGQGAGFGFRSLSSTGFCKSFTIEQL